MRRLNKISLFSLPLLASLLVAQPGWAAGSAKESTGTAVTVNGVTIPQSDMDFIVKRQVLQGAKDTPKLREGVRDFLVAQQVIAQEATREGIDKTADYQEEIKLTSLDMLRNVMLDQYLKAHPSKATKPEDKQAADGKQIEALVNSLKAKAKVTDQTGAVANVNGVVIPQADLEFIIRHQVEKGAKDTPELRGKVRDYLVVQQIMAQEANREGIDKSADYLTAIRFSHIDALRNGLFANYTKAHPITTAMAKAEYDKHAAAMPPKTEYHARHILLKTEADAKSVIASLNGGQTFDAVAKAKSMDEGSKATGGDLGWVTPDRFVKEFGEAMVKLKKGETTQTPVKTQYGYHVIQLLDSRTAPLPTFDQVKDRIFQFMQRDQLEKFVEGLKSKAKVA